MPEVLKSHSGLSLSFLARGQVFTMQCYAEGSTFESIKGRSCAVPLSGNQLSDSAEIFDFLIAIGNKNRTFYLQKTAMRK